MFLLNINKTIYSFLIADITVKICNSVSCLKIILQSSLQNTLPENLYESAHPCFLSSLIILRYTPHTSKEWKIYYWKQTKKEIVQSAIRWKTVTDSNQVLDRYITNFLSHTGLGWLNQVFDSSNVNEVIGAVLNSFFFFFFLQKHFARTKSTKSTNTQPSKSTKSYKQTIRVWWVM